MKRDPESLKVTIYVPEPMRTLLEEDARLTDRSVSWLLRRAYARVREDVLAEAGRPWKTQAVDGEP